VRDDDVDARLRRRVQPARDRARERRIEVRDLDLDVHARGVGVDRRAAAHVDLQPAVAAVGGARDEHAAVDAPAHNAAVGVHLVLRRLEAKQHERARQQHDRAAVVVVRHADQAERAARQKAPVRARQALQVHRRPHLRQRRGRQRDIGRLDRAHGAVGRHRRVVVGIDDHGAGDAPRTAQQCGEPGHRHTVPAGGGRLQRAASAAARSRSCPRR
jgi:hypothetical protein